MKKIGKQIPTFAQKNTTIDTYKIKQHVIFKITKIRTKKT